jgi:hypothetical protein
MPMLFLPCSKRSTVASATFARFASRPRELERAAPPHGFVDQ